MTICIAVKTSSSVIFASDSKLTTTGIGGLDPKGQPIWLDQTYDNADKIAHDPSKRVMVMVAGNPQVGEVSALDVVQKWELGSSDALRDLYPEVDGLMGKLSLARAEFWKKWQVQEKIWPSMTMLVSIARLTPSSTAPKIWRFHFEGSKMDSHEILETPGLWMEGFYPDAYGLLYGARGDILEKLREELKVSQDDFKKAYAKASLSVIAPIGKINFTTIPIQDAMDIAYFVAQVQIQMCKYLPGTPACGGPVDMMLIRTTPELRIDVVPGKRLHHPADY